MSTSKKEKSEKEAEQLSIFDIFLCLPYRIIALLNMGLWLWYFCVRVCLSHNIDIFQVLKLQVSQQDLLKIQSRTLDFTLSITAVSFCSVAGCILFNIQGYQWKAIEFIPLIVILYIILRLFYGRSPNKRRLTQTVRRILIGNIDMDFRSNDILLTDTLTSYSKVMLDFIIYLLSLRRGSVLPNIETQTVSINRDINAVLEMAIISYPILIRFNQCLSEYHFSGNRNKLHLYNSIKYCTGLLPLLIRIYLQASTPHNKLQTIITHLWYLSLFIHSLFGLIWDISIDWNFQMFSTTLSGQSELLRTKLMFNVKLYYYLAIIIDTCLRFVWIGRFNGYLNHHLFQRESGYFLLQCLEIFRRWVWLFIKVETEFLKTMNADVENTYEMGDIKYT
ncbi:Lumenal endoplasmic reticulum proteins retention [Komagataella phaffii CBS 7435]|uniref:Predicted membrane protein required for the retention of lumenal endoplasmic reticulum proteins n=2 Tax=Komagataella phaffii TaxID=460519 RepID=C4R6I2_KOMPG|nr:uncharacterized protein PAS_chr3_1102 [Komagataella phaffii GS115]AOA63538.1 GQ67_04242T0 [Komagataella phaffii]CAH2448986.1 Lumenal endoplasmic reticulum proteins retention [Komagataella phaffii CBS 7435]AOA69013.1 GQ68_04214T0 [Komagataella phaffii GS115]CAY71168.1 Predicted membrane protein required for the retention of lumenal endoplasmic reticulum proteins [Komagataella phaffii GS115]SCV12149.1 Lumenal endoplasmic reticulum proteins retention [Komagataella phaffii CBS 7435]